MFTIVKIAAWIVGYHVGVRVTYATLTAIENTTIKISK